MTLQHNEIKCFSRGRFYEEKCDLIHFHINIFYGCCWVFLPVRQTRSWVAEQCFMTWRWFSLLSLACQTLGPPHSWLSPQWNSIRRSHYSDIVKLGFPSLPTYPDTMIQPPFSYTDWQITLFLLLSLLFLQLFLPFVFSLSLASSCAVSLLFD